MLVKDTNLTFLDKLPVKKRQIEFHELAKQVVKEDAPFLLKEKVYDYAKGELVDNKKQLKEESFLLLWDSEKKLLPLKKDDLSNKIEEYIHNFRLPETEAFIQLAVLKKYEHDDLDLADHDFLIPSILFAEEKTLNIFANYLGETIKEDPISFTDLIIRELTYSIVRHDYDQVPDSLLKLTNVLFEVIDYLNEKEKRNLVLALHEQLCKTHQDQNKQAMRCLLQMNLYHFKNPDVLINFNSPEIRRLLTYILVHCLPLFVEDYYMQTKLALLTHYLGDPNNRKMSEAAILQTSLLFAEIKTL